jgi:lactate permease
MVDLFGILISALPFAIAGLGLVVLGWPAPLAGAASLATAVLGALVWPGLWGAAVPGALFGGLGISAQVLFVLFGGLWLYNLLSAGGAVDDVARFLGRLEPDRVSLAAVVVVGVAPFFESVTGFGVAVVISAPILLAAGFAPLRAAILATWGQCAVPWGALGVGTVIGAHLAGMDFGILSDASALLNLPLFPVYGLAALALADGWSGVTRRGAEAVVLGLVAGLGTLLTSFYLVPELSGAVGGLAATAVFLAWRPRRLVAVPVRALLPYAFLLALLAAANGIVALRGALEELGPVFEGPGLPLLVSGAFAAAVFGLGGNQIGAATRKTTTQWLPTAGAVLTFVLAGEVVAGSGAAGLLAGGAESLGGLFPAVSPVLAALGGALTGSNAASNALFMPLQVDAARGLDLSTGLTAAVQNVAGSQTSMLSPQRLVLAATATGLLGRETEILRVALAPVAVSIGLLAIVGMLAG